MPVLRRLAAIVLVGAIAAGCSSATQPGWTYAPPPPATPTPASSAAASGAPSGAPSSGPSAPASSGAPSASSGASAAPSGGSAATGTVVQLAASGIQYTTTSLDAPADQTFSIEFDNQDAGIQHNVEIKNSAGADVFKGTIFTGPAKQTYSIPALKAGAYTFNCSVHPNMTGTLTVK